MQKQPRESVKIWLIFAITSIVFLIVFAIAPTKDFFSEWRQIQKDYNQYIKTLPKRIPEIDIGLRQRWNQDLDKIDRCTTCHISIDNPEFSEAAQPYTSHPEIYHDVQEIGCTTCHQGQGLATNTAEAHGKTKYWEKPMLPVEYLEASCGKCHQNGDVPKAPILSRGRRLLADFSCAGCHRLGGIKPATFKPSLDGIGKKTNRAWLLRWLKNPEEVRPDTKMPDFHLPEQEANILTDFLMSQLDFADNIKLSPIPEKLSARLKDPDFISRGKGIFRKARCVSCHTVEQRGGSLAPELGNIGSKTNAVWLYNFLENPKRLQPNIPMPQYGFSDEQRAAVVAYMVNDFQDWGWSPDTSGHTQDPDYYDKGKKIFKSYNCGGCHQLSGIEGSSETGPDLRQIADKPLYQFDFGRLDSLPKTKANFIYLKLKSPRAFREDLQMPEFKLSEEELQALTTALLAQSTEVLPEKYRVSENVKAAPNPEGPFGKILDKYSCLSCHTINGRGETIAPDLTRVGSALQMDWTTDYFKIPYSLRPIMTERMPNLFIPEEDLGTIRQYFELVLRSDAIGNIQINVKDSSLIATGKEIYNTNGCSACHQINNKGGYVGPPLDQAGERLTAGWTYSWLRSPRKFNPETIEPQHNFSERELKALTGYIMSLRGESN